ncbi:MAG TPA: Ku protein [Thermohalobaculum sp.]|nr:Ku protein [Thermohalobaculum sp.]
MAIGRPVWTGHIRLSLVSMPVKLYSAVESGSKLSFRQIHEPSGKPIRYEKVVPGIGPVDAGEIVKGYEIRKGEYVLLKPEEIDEIRLESKKTMDLVQFVDVCEIDPIYFDRPYFVAPDGDLAEDAFRVVRDALRKSKKVGLGQFTMRGREYVGALKPCDRGMVLETLRFEEDLRAADAYFSEIGTDKAEPELLSLAEELIERKSKPFDAAAFKDSYAEALEELVRNKARGKVAVTSVGKDEAKPKGEVVDLMAALKQSLGENKKKRSTSSGGTRKKKVA